MKETTERRYEYFTVYVSDDGCCKNEDRNVVEAYEKAIKENNPVKLFEIKNMDDLEDNHRWKIYGCSNLQEFAAALSDVCHFYCVAKRDLDDAYSKYNENEKFYAFLIEDTFGDKSWADLTVCTVYDLLADYESEINKTEEYLQNLNEEKRKLIDAINKMSVL